MNESNKPDPLNRTIQYCIILGKVYRKRLKIKGDRPSDRYVHIREMGSDFAIFIDRICPESREKSLAITKLEEVVMWANAAIARRE